ncbi:MAG: hypothetical protein B7Z31_00130 [Rhodobacterales bacterium 12-65-15]|nr:MAG: hypothetical protein B7Z31_00130 [Rhodobacterales bacterium 12-65-15]
MTTPAAAALYEAQHVYAHEGRPVAIHNPRNAPIESLPIIFGFNNGGSPGWMSAVLLAEDGTPLGGHLCSSETYMLADLGILQGTRPDRHENDFQKHYPDGYRMEFVGGEDIAGHESLNAAIARANANKED